MKTWHWLVLGVGAYFLWAYRGAVVNALTVGAGPRAVALPTPQPSAGQSGHPGTPY